MPSAIAGHNNVPLLSFSDSYLGRLRARIGSELVLMPGAMVVLRRPADGRVLFTRRADDGTWCLPAGAAEPGGSFAATAIGELKEEAGVIVAEDDLIPFATLSLRLGCTRSSIRTETKPTASPSASLPNAGAASHIRTARRRRRSSSPTRRARLRQYTARPLMHLSC